MPFDHERLPPDAPRPEPTANAAIGNLGNLSHEVARASRKVSARLYRRFLTEA